MMEQRAKAFDAENALKIPQLAVDDALFDAGETTNLRMEKSSEPLDLRQRASSGEHAEKERVNQGFEANAMPAACAAAIRDLIKY